MTRSPRPGETEAFVEVARRSPESVVIAMSGGVDSSVAAALLVEQGHRVIGVTIKTFCYGETPTSARSCCGLEGIRDARAVCDRLGIPHYVFDMEESFTRDVINDFVEEYAAGRTPNPCVRCNSHTKIPDLLRRTRALGADAVATGHYARRSTTDGVVRIRRGVDRFKDQSYFLWALPPEVLPALRFPIGELEKSEVRERARALGLSTADKPESQEICFVPAGDYTEFLARRLGEAHPALADGPLVSSDGRVIGRHAGYGRYTVGQRRGLGGGFRRPLYVLAVHAQTREVVVGGADELLRGDVALGKLNWLAPPPTPDERLLVQVRHRAPPVPARVRHVGADRAELVFAAPQRAVTPGQSGVVYRGEDLVGGGLIL
jgi:tRNA-uridine 2-sulfurtransferase